MNSKKLTMALAIVLLSVFMLSVCLFFSQTAVYAASAETEQDISGNGENAPTMPETDEDETLTEGGADSVSDSVKEYLQSIYGDNYEKYYNQIIEYWGSIENFLLNASDILPEEYQYKATELLTTINAYIGIAADAVLLILACAYLIYRVKKNKTVNANFTTLKACDNQIEVAQLAIIKSLKAQSAALQVLLPGAKFEDAVAELAESDKALDDATEEVQKIV